LRVRARDEVALEEQVGDPEGVDDVLGGADEADVVLVGDHDDRDVARVPGLGDGLAVGADERFALAVGVGELPVPLERGHVGAGLGVLAHLGDVVLDDHG
ncbi:hypothetical protein ADL26_02630, partial [Thermoactinomyces vulgaris]